MCLFTSPAFSQTARIHSAGVLWIQENTDLKGTITDAYCAMDSVTLDCDNFEPQPTYPKSYENPAFEAEGYTTFQVNCLVEVGQVPREYTCNFGEPNPYVRPEANETVPAPAPSPPAVCGTPADMIE